MESKVFILFIYDGFYTKEVFCGGIQIGRRIKLNMFIVKYGTVQFIIHVEWCCNFFNNNKIVWYEFK